MQVLFLSDRMNDNIKIALFCDNKYEILCYGHKIKVCAECSRFSIGFRYKHLKYYTWKRGTKIMLHSVVISLRLTILDLVLFLLGRFKYPTLPLLSLLDLFSQLSMTICRVIQSSIIRLCIPLVRITVWTING